MSLLVMGSMVHDYFAFTSRIPSQGEAVVGNRFYTGLGGKGSNQAIMASFLFDDASRVDFVGRVGKDSLGTNFLNLYSSLNLSTKMITVDESTSTGASIIMVNEKDGDNRIVVVLGANMTLDVDHVGKWDKYKLVLIGGCETPLKAIMDTLIRAKENKCTTVVNAAPVPNYSSEEIKAMLRLVDILVVNEIEVEQIALLITAGHSHGSSSLEANCQLLIEFVDTLIVTLGDKGAVLKEAKDKSKTIQVQADKTWLENKKVVDTTGAGDAFVGSLCYFMVDHPHLTLHEMIRRACRVATKTVTKSGTTNAYPRRTELSKDIFATTNMQ